MEPSLEIGKAFRLGLPFRCHYTISVVAATKKAAPSVRDTFSHFRDQLGGGRQVPISLATVCWYVWREVSTQFLHGLPT